MWLVATSKHDYHSIEKLSIVEHNANVQVTK
jgi:hypothetical protein